MHSTSPTLLSRLRDPDDQRAWRDFDARYGELIVRYCRGRGLQPADADDVRQLVMARLARALPTFRYCPQRGRFRTFLGCIVRNEIIRAAGRPRQAPGRVSLAEQIPERAGGPPAAVDDEWERQWMHHHLRLAMRRLRLAFEPRSLEVFERLLAGQTVEQVAGDLDLSAQAVHKIKQRIREKLKVLVAAQIAEEESPRG